MKKYDAAELMIALWKLGGGDNMPLDGRLDRALHEAAGRLPAPLDVLTFGGTAVGLRCYERAEILLAEEEALLVEPDGRSFAHGVLKLAADEAREIVLCAGRVRRPGRGSRRRHRRSRGTPDHIVKTAAGTELSLAGRL